MGIKLNVAAKTDVGLARTNNEDAFVVADLNRSDTSAQIPAEFDVKERGILLAVSDGMGGEAAGEVASALVVETLRRVLVENAPESEAGKTGITKAIEAAVTRANEEVLAAAQDPGKEGMGATLTAVYVHGSAAFIAEVGDSRAYLIRGRRVRQMTKDQSFVQLLLDSGAISEEEAKNFPHRNVILQAMGRQKDLNIALGRLALRRNDRLILCSDGLSNKVTPEEMQDVINAAPSLDAACDKLVALANERGGDDNCTVVLAQATGDDLSVHRDEERVTHTFEVVKAGPTADLPSEPAPATPAPPETTPAEKAPTENAATENAPAEKPRASSAPMKAAAPSATTSSSSMKAAEKAHEPDAAAEKKATASKPAPASPPSIAPAPPMGMLSPRLILAAVLVAAVVTAVAYFALKH